MLATIIGISRLHIKATTSYESFGVANRLKQCVFPQYSLWRVGPCKVEARNFSNWRAFVPKKWSTHHIPGQVYCSRQILATRPGILQYFKNTFSSRLNPTTTKVTNNVMLYRFERPYMFKIATAFAVISLIACWTMVDVVYKVLCKGLFVKDKDLKTRLKEHVIPLAAITTGVLAGPIIAGVVLYVIVRSVKYVILRKGGQDVTIVTYHPYKKEIAKTVPLDDVSSLTTRAGLKSYIPMKIKGTRWNYLLDKNGHFVNPDLFDSTAGVKRFD